MIDMNRQNCLYRDVSSSFTGTRVELVTEPEEDVQSTTDLDLAAPGGSDKIDQGSTAMRQHGSRYAHGFFAQPVVVPQTDSKLPFVVMIGSALLPAANLVHRATLALRLAVSSS